MEQAPRRGRIFYGWWIVAVCIIVNMLHAGAAFYAFSRFLPTLLEEFESGATVIAGAASVYMLTVGLTGPLAGKLTDKVVELGKPVFLHMMDSQDRRILHTALMNSERANTRGEGEKLFRVLSILPK